MERKEKEPERLGDWMHEDRSGGFPSGWPSLPDAPPGPSPVRNVWEMGRSTIPDRIFRSKGEKKSQDVPSSIPFFSLLLCLPFPRLLDELLHLGERILSPDVDGLEPILQPFLPPSRRDEVEQGGAVLPSVEGDADLLRWIRVAGKAILNYLHRKTKREKKSNDDDDEEKGTHKRLAHTLLDDQRWKRKPFLPRRLLSTLRGNRIKQCTHREAAVLVVVVVVRC